MYVTFGMNFEAMCYVLPARRPVSRGLIHHENVRNLVVCISVGHIRKLWQALLLTNARAAQK